MKIKELIELIEPYTELPIIEFTIAKKIFEEKNGREIFNKTIRNNVENKFGAYVWVNGESNEIVYIGMAGKIKTDGTYSSHSIQNRLLASRKKDKATKKDIQTNDYVANFMIDNNVTSLNFYIFYTNTGVPPTYIEALLLNSFYKKNNCLPKLNKSF